MRIRVTAILSGVLLAAALGLPVSAAEDGPTAGGDLAAEAAAVSAPVVNALEAPGAAQVRTRILRAWSMPAADLDERVERTARAGYQLGIRNLEGPARALLLNSDYGTPVERARAALRLAPGLPAAHAGLGAALWDAGEPGAALSAYAAAARAVPGHLDASLWSSSVLGTWAFLGIFFGALLFLGLVAFDSAQRFVGHLGQLRDELSTAARWAVVGSILLLGTAFGEGPAGLVLGTVFLASMHGSLWRRSVIAAATACLVVAAFPLVDAVRAADGRFDLEPVAIAAHAVEQGTPAAHELARVRHAGTADPLAARALALRSKRSGDLETASRQYAALLDELGAEAAADLLNNAAGVELARGDLAAATKLYERASDREPSALVLFNLSQAYGRAIRLDEQDLALAEAQSIDPEQIAHLTGEFGATALGLVTDIPLPAGDVMARQSPATASPSLALERRRFAPGRLGESFSHAAIAAAVAFVLGTLSGLLMLRAVGGGDDTHYSELARLLQNREGDSDVRMKHIARIRARQARVAQIRGIAAVIVPGGLGPFGGQSFLGWAGATLFAFGVAVPFVLENAPVDPMALGSLPGAARIAALTVLAVTYAVCLGFGLVLRERV